MCGDVPTSCYRVNEVVGKYADILTLKQKRKMGVHDF